MCFSRHIKRYAALSITSVKGLEFVVSFIRNKIIASISGAEGLYFFSLLMSVVSNLTSIQFAGVKTLFVQETAGISDSGKVFRKSRVFLVSVLLILVISFSLFFIANLCGLAEGIVHGVEWLYLLYIVICTSVGFSTINIFRAQRNFSSLRKILLWGPLASLIALLFAWTLKGDMRNFIWMTLLFQSTVMLIASIAILPWRNILKSQSTIVESFRHSRNSISLALPAVITGGVSFLVLYSLNIHYGSNAGFYNAGVQFSKSLMGVATASVGLVVYPELVNRFKNKINVVDYLFRQSIIFVLPLGLLSMFSFVYSKELIALLYDEGFERSNRLFLISLISIGPRILLVFLGYVSLASKKKNLFIIMEISHQLLILGASLLVMQIWALDFLLDSQFFLSWFFVILYFLFVRRWYENLTKIFLLIISVLLISLVGYATIGF